MSNKQICRAGARQAARAKRRRRVRKSVVGSKEVPRLCVFRSLRYTYAQLISDESGDVLGSVSTKDIQADGKSAGSVESAKLLGEKLGKQAKENGIEKVLFDRNGYLYHGRVAAVAEGAREAGLNL